MLNTLNDTVVTESSIDALSYHQLKKHRNSLYISFGGSVTVEQLETVKRIINNSNPSPELKIISAVDNDEMGKIYTKKFKEAFTWDIVEDYPRLNDYNEDLKKSQLRGIKI